MSGYAGKIHYEFRNLKSGKMAFNFLNEDSYNGEWVEDLPHGLGTYDKVSNLGGSRWIYRDCKFIEGEPVSGFLRKIANRDSSHEFYTYHGEFKEWIEDGRGVASDIKNPPNMFTGLFSEGRWVEGKLQTENGYIYNGKFNSEGRLYNDPHGVLKFPHDIEAGYAEYTGKFEEGKFLEGHMRYREHNCYLREYTGTFLNGKLHGTDGVLTFKDVNPMNYSVFKGEFREGRMFHGNMLYHDGTIYEGPFFNEKPHGDKAVFKFFPQHPDYTIFSGEMANGLFANGVLHYQCGDKFDGAFISGFPKVGSMVFSTKDTYTGDFNGINQGRLMHGQGSMIFDDPNLRNGKVQFAGMFVGNFPVRGKTRYIQGHDYTGETNQKYGETGHGKMVWRHSPEDQKKLDTMNEFTGEWKDGLMIYGELKYFSQRLYRGRFNNEQRFHGRGIFKCPDDRTHFDGIFNNHVRETGKLMRSVLLGSGSTMYSGKFDSNGDEDDTEAVFNFPDAREFKGEFKGGKMIQGTITYTQKGQAPGGVVHSSELEYTGFVDSAGARHGKGSLTWSGPLHPLGFVTCVGDFYNDHALGDCKVTFHEGHKFEGKMANSLMVQGNLELADGRVFTGSFNEAQFMHGNGTMLFEDQRRFTGEFAENNHSTGTTLYPNGIKYQSTFYVNTKADKKICHPCFCSENNFKNENKDFPFSSKYVQPRPQCLRCARDLIHIRKYGNGSGVVTFSDGFEYQHSPEVSGSFQDRVASLIAGRLAAAEAINSQVVSAMTELDIWPKVKPVEPILIDEKFATPLFTAREIGGEDRLRAKFNTWRDLMDQLENLSRRSAGLLEKELARNKSLVERFGDRWTLPPSAQINLVFHQRLNRGTDILQDERSKCVADYAHLEEHKQKLVALLKPASVYEKELFDKEETCSLRLRMIELNKSVHEVMERRVKLLDEYKQLALSLDIIPALASLPDASASHLEIVIADTLQKLDPLCRDLEATASQHRELMEQSKRAHAELEAFKTLLRTSIRDQMCAFILAGTELFDYLNPRLDSAIGTNQTFLTYQRAELADAAAVMVADRETQSREVAASLLHAELEAAIAARNIETCKSIIDHKIPDIKLQIDAPNSNGDTLVSQAIMLGHSELIKVLADGGADMELRYNSHYSYLYFAIQDKRCDQKSIIPTATALIAAKADPNAIADNKEQVCMVQIVAREDRLDILQALVEKKADLRREVKNKSGLGRTALHWACAANLPTTSMVFYLIKNGLIINQIDNDLNTPLHFARNIKTSVMLVENGAQLNAKNKNNVRAMDECLATLTSNGVSDDDIKDVNFRWKQLERTARQRITFNIGNVGEEPTPDNNVPACLCCGTKFSSLTRRNNCRVCNLVSCANCVPKRVEATQAGSVVKVRMCDGCYNQGFYKLQG